MSIYEHEENERTKRWFEICEKEEQFRNSYCDHRWTHLETLHMPEQGPPIDIDVCVRCGVRQKAQP